MQRKVDSLEQQIAAANKELAELGRRLDSEKQGRCVAARADANHAR